MKKRILTILLAAMVLALPGCSSGTESGSEKTAKNITIDQTTDSDGKTGEEADEQEAGEMQAAADAIDKAHADKEDTLSDTSVDQGEWNGKMLMLDEAQSWVRQSSTDDDNGGFAETYSCDGRLQYSWNCVVGETGEAQALADEYIRDRGWTVASVAANDDLTGKLGLDTCEYTAYEDDEGYSILHRGILVMDEDAYYTADFRMMEGDMGEYEPSVREWIAQVYFA